MAVLIAAAVLALQTGLPERAAYTGRLVTGEQPVAPEIGALAPPFAGQTLDDSVIRLADLQGQPVLLNFWATWCEPCRVEMPDLQRVYELVRGQGVRLLAINLGEPPSVVREWVREFDLSFDVILDEQQTITTLYYLRGQPSTYVISPGGTITRIFYGPTTAEALLAALAPFLK